ncbi:hypothetical protein FS837_008706 [Tulasnella sp. UAMH 9824]|nr:hypothetical protein FS837_008706 [Tulasnella sp. UAMH 9824]
MPPRPSAPSAPKTIIPAFDGTLNKFTRHKTNVLRLFGLLDKADDDKQVLYYQPGVGTYLAEGNAWSPTIKAIKETLDGVFAWYVRRTTPDLAKNSSLTSDVAQGIWISM